MKQPAEGQPDGGQSSAEELEVDCRAAAGELGRRFVLVAEGGAVEGGFGRHYGLRPGGGLSAARWGRAAVSAAAFAPFFLSNLGLLILLCSADVCVVDDETR
ncbi:hypothetical protein ACFQ61_32435 [Streptomyces sp. NPDC056500]|uniref:hypothetical protein n=1 Tax=Streptomyces sp. NPDC056500 TaxID=3345840 RepID=UPI00367533A9